VLVEREQTQIGLTHITIMPPNNKKKKGAAKKASKASERDENSVGRGAGPGVAAQLMPHPDYYREPMKQRAVPDMISLTERAASVRMNVPNGDASVDTSSATAQRFSPGLSAVGRFRKHSDRKRVVIVVMRNWILSFWFGIQFT